MLLNANLVKKVVFPLEILPLIHLASAIILGTIWFLLLFAGAAALGISFHLSALLLPLLLLPVLLLALGVALFVAASTVYVRDMPHLTAVLIQILFFMTPIFYPVEMVPVSCAGSWPSIRWPPWSTRSATQSCSVSARTGDLCLEHGTGFHHLPAGAVLVPQNKKGFADVL